LHQRSHSDEEPEVIDLTVGVDHALSELTRSLGMVVNLELIDGTAACGVLGAATSNILILEHWSDSSSGPNGDPFTVSVADVRRIVIP
jgi:hypothetical protein